MAVVGGQAGWVEEWNWEIGTELIYLTKRSCHFFKQKVMMDRNGNCVFIITTLPPFIMQHCKM